MDQLTISLSVILATYAPCFRVEAYRMFEAMVAGWIVCVGQRTIGRVWETTGRSQSEDHSAAYRLFSEAVWNWDELARLTLVLIFDLLTPGVVVWLVVDDTLCHKRGARVAFGGMFLDPVLSTSRHKNYRYGNNWVTLGVVVKLPFRQDRYWCLNILWRICEKRGTKSAAEHRTKAQLAAEMISLVAKWLPDHKLRVVADVAYIGKHILKKRAKNVDVIGPICWKAALFTVLGECSDRRRKKGDRIPQLREILAGNDPRWPSETIQLDHPRGTKTLTVKIVRRVCWYGKNGPAEVMIVLVRDPERRWRDEALLSTDTSLSAEEIIHGYCRRWSVEVAYADAKGKLGFHEPQVRCSASVQRAHPMAWFVGCTVILWYVLEGHLQPKPQRHRPWYQSKVEPTFADMLSTCRYHLWRKWLQSAASPEELQRRQEWLIEYVAAAA